MARNPLHVVPNTDGKGGDWTVKGGHGIKTTSHRKKSAAIKRAKKAGRQNKTGVVVHRKDGTVQYGYKCDTSGSRAKLIKSS